MSLINLHVVFRCSWIIGKDCKPQPLTTAGQNQMIADLIEPMANDALRTICIAYKDFVPSNLSSLFSHLTLFPFFLSKLPPI